MFTKQQYYKQLICSTSVVDGTYGFAEIRWYLSTSLLRQSLFLYILIFFINTTQHSVDKFRRYSCSGTKIRFRGCLLLE